MVRRFAIERLELAALESATHRLSIGVDCGGGHVAELPTVAVVGGSPGPTLMAVAGVHGDEYEGMEAIRRVAAATEPVQLAGRFLGIVVANPFAFRARTRATPLEVDGLNLARVFPGDSAGQPTERLAAALLALIRRTLTEDDLLIDFHSGSADVAFAPLIGVRDVPGPARQVAADAARRFGLPRLWLIPDGQGPLNAETARLGIPTLGTETTGRAGCEDADVEEFRRGVGNMFLHMRMLAGESPVPVDAAFRPTVDVIATAEGFLRTTIRVGDVVEASQGLGTIVSELGDEVVEVVAPVGGEVWAARSMPAVRAGELCFMVAIGIAPGQQIDAAASRGCRSSPGSHHRRG